MRDRSWLHLTTSLGHQALAVLCVCALISAALYAAARSLTWPMLYDGSFVNYMAWRILSGAVPYRDLFDTNFPGTYLIHMAVIEWLGPSDRAFYVFNLILVVAATVALVAFCRPFGAWTAALAPALFAAYYFTLGPTIMGERDFLIAPLVMFGAHGVASALETDRSPLKLWLAGLPIGVALANKPFPAFCLVMLAGLVFAFGVRQQPRRALVGAGALLAGAAVAPLATVVWLAAVGGLGAFLQIFADYVLPVYGTLERHSLLDMSAQLWSQVQFAAPLLPLAAFWNPRLAQPRFARYAVLAACLIYGALHFFMQGRGWIYHMIPLFYFGLATAAVIIGPLLSRKSGRLRLIALGALAFAAVPLSIQCASVGRQDYTLTKNQPLAAQLIADLSEYKLAATDTVQMLDMQWAGFGAFYRLHIRPPTRYMFDFPLFVRPDLPVVQAIRREFISDLSANRPRLIVFVHQSWPDIYGPNRFDNFPELIALLDDQYRVSKVKDNGYTIYERR